MIKLKQIHQELLRFNGHDHVSAIVNFDWLLDSINNELKVIENLYKQILIPTNLKEIFIRFKFNHKNISIQSISGDSKFELYGFDFDLELIDPLNNIYGSLHIKCHVNIIGSLDIKTGNNGATDLSYSFTPIEKEEIEVINGQFDDQVILSNYPSIGDFETSVKAITLFLDYNEYLDDLFASIPTPNVFESLASYRLNQPYKIEFKDVNAGGDYYNLLFVKGAALKNSSEFCNCGEPGGVTTVDVITQHDGDNSQGSSVNRTRQTRDAGQVTDQISGKFVAGFLFPFHDERKGEFKTFMKEFTAQTSLSTNLKDSGKQSGVNWSYNITAHVPLQNITTDVKYDATKMEYSIIVEMPHKVEGNIHLRKKIGCGVSIRDRIEISNGSIDPYKITLQVRFIFTSRGREVVLIPETEASLNFRLKPKGIFSFLVSFFGRIIDRKLVQEEIVNRSNSQIISFIKNFIIPTIPQEKMNVGSTIEEKTLFIALGENDE